MYFVTVQEYFGCFIAIFAEIQQVISISQIPAKLEKWSQGEMFQVLQGASFRSVLASEWQFSPCHFKLTLFILLTLDVIFEGEV